MSQGGGIWNGDNIIDVQLSILVKGQVMSAKSKVPITSGQLIPRASSLNSAAV